MKRPGWIAVIAVVAIAASGAPWAECLAAERQETQLDRQPGGRPAQRPTGSIGDTLAGWPASSSTFLAIDGWEERGAS